MCVDTCACLVGNGGFGMKSYGHGPVSSLLSKFWW